MTVATLLFTCLIFLLLGWKGGMYFVTALSVGGIVCIAASNGGSTSQDLKTGFLLGATPKYQQISILIGAALSAVLLGPILLLMNNSGSVYMPASKVAPGLHMPISDLTGLKKEVYPDPNSLTRRIQKWLHLSSADAELAPKEYYVWQKTDEPGGTAKRYLVDETGAAVWLVDPGINGSYKTRPDGTTVPKYDAPKAMLMSYIIQGILDSKLPWALVLFGIMIAIVLELCGIPSLAFAVGVYLPISSSAPVFVGGAVRWLVDRKLRHELREHKLDEAQLAAESDKSPGVLLASGYIAGGAIAGIIIAFIQGVTTGFDAELTKWAESMNPFYGGPNADWLALIPFVLLGGFLYLVGREKLLAGKKQAAM
jgi:hypothetical protein